MTGWVVLAPIVLWIAYRLGYVRGQSQADRTLYRRHVEPWLKNQAQTRETLLQLASLDEAHTATMNLALYMENLRLKKKVRHLARRYGALHTSLRSRGIPFTLNVLHHVIKHMSDLDYLASRKP